MPLIARIPHDHTIRGFRNAARMRFGEATRLVASGDRLAGVYLCGYAAEMLLKAAYFRLSGKTPTDPITFSDIQDAKAEARGMYNVQWTGNLHDVTKWGELLVEKRTVIGQPYSLDFARELNTLLVRIYLNWRENIRYHVNRPRPVEVYSTFQATKWLFVMYRRL